MLGGVIGDPGEDIGEPRLRVEALQFRRADQGLHHGGALAAVPGAAEPPRLAPECNAAQRLAAGIVADADPAFVEEAGERRPALEQVVQRLGDVGMVGEPAAFAPHLGLEIGDQRRDRGPACGHSSATAAVHATLNFAPGEAFQFDWSYEIVAINGAVTVTHMRLCHSRMPFMRACLRESQEPPQFPDHDPFRSGLERLTDAQASLTPTNGCSPSSRAWTRGA